MIWERDEHGELPDAFFARRKIDQAEWQDKACEDIPRAMAKMSNAQRAILLWLHRRYQEGVSEAAEWGARWKTKGASRSKHASLSRTLARLEERGFILRQNIVGGSPGFPHKRMVPEDPAPSRTCRLQLMPAGRLAAEILAREATPPSG